MINSRTVECVSPSTAQPGAVTLGFVMDGTLDPIVSEVNFEYFEVPRVEKVWPSRGRLSGGTVVSVTGASFRASEVLCRVGAGHVSGAEAMVVSSSLITLVTPASGAPGTVAVELSFNGGVDYTIDGREFAYGASAVVELLKPSHGLSGADGQVVTVVGSDFKQSAELGCMFGDSDMVNGMFLSSSTVACTVPAREAGMVSVSISSNGVEDDNSQALYEYMAAWSLWSVSPSTGPTSGGTEVMMQVTGALLEGDLGDLGCMFGSVLVPAIVVSASAATCKAPASAQGVVGLSLALEGHSGSLHGTLAFEYYSMPAVSGLLPRRGTVFGGTMVSVTGSGFREAGLRCRFGGEEVLGGDGAQFVSSSIVACEAPASVSGTGTVAVEVSVNGGSDFTSDRVEYLYEESATVTGLRPSVGVSGASDQVVTVMGEHFAR